MWVDQKRQKFKCKCKGTGLIEVKVIWPVERIATAHCPCLRCNRCGGGAFAKQTKSKI